MAEHNVIIRKTDKFMLINYFLEGVISVLDPKQEINLLPPDMDELNLGKTIKEYLLKSRKVSFDEINAIISLGSKDIFLESMEKNKRRVFI